MTALSHVVVNASMPLRSPQPSNINEISRSQIKSIFDFPWSRHVGQVCQRQRNRIVETTIKAIIATITRQDIYQT